MNPEYKQKWIEALRSGQYRQTIGCLRSVDDGYCCLGVLREIIAPGSTLGAIGLLDYWHRERVGLTEHQQDQLANMNDCGKSFDQIANYIEKNL